MSGNGTNATAAYDYSAYYDESINFSPCDDVDLKDFGHVFLPTLYSLVFVLGFIGNGLVVCVLVKYRNQTNLTDICLCNLALSDLLFVLTLPFYAHYSAVRLWAFGDFMCRFISGCHRSGFFSSIFFMIIMTLDRYLVIVHAHKVARYRTLQAGVTVSVFVWLLSLFVSLPALIFTKVTDGPDGLECNYVPNNNAWKLYDIFATNLLGLMIPFVVMVGCYSRIILTLVNMRNAKKKHCVVRLIICIVVTFFLFWAPYNISIFLKFLQSEGKMPNSCKFHRDLKLTITVTETFAYTHCCLNPIVYAFVGQKFMKRAVHMLSNWLPGIHLRPCSDFSETLFRRSSVPSKSSVTSTVIM
ncbi:C-C chemokine receptor type 5-like [Seriola aureovittata]|uniref:C-C chemokine receptor type 5-like n=1 Tax=Seriola aureovittata TaxID=2871759 RepID=UPI0024BEEC19|nr:C-C chemokine receptor type 5-like [Seriola aureovittata]